MKHIADLLAILLMGDGMAKILSPIAHNRFYQFSWAPQAYNNFLQRQTASPWPGIMAGIVMLAVGASISRIVEHQAQG